MIETHRRSLVARALLALLSAYRAWVSPQLGLACRFVPTCSQYAAQAIESHGTLRGLALSLLRLSRCHPLGGSGLDPVPSRGER